MKKRILACLLILCFWLAIPALAVSDLPRLVDDAGLLRSSEETALQEMLDKISQRQQVDVVIVTVDTLNGKSPSAYADDFFDYNDYGFGTGRDGILLLVSMEDRDWWISTSGYGITAFTDAGLEYLSEQFLPELSDGEYAQAFEIFAEVCDDFITRAKNGDPYDIQNLPKEPFKVGSTLFFCVILGFVVALVVTWVMKRQLKSVRAQTAAADYVNSGSLRVTESRDMYLYSRTTRIEKPRDTGSRGGSSIHRSSSGRSHGGRGGKF